MTTLSLRSIEKKFGAVHAVVSANLDVDRGLIHAVVGENGAGKSTLLKIAAGVTPPDSGEVTIDGRTLSPHTAGEAASRGVAMVQQHFALISVMTVLENLVLGREPMARLGRVDLSRARQRADRVAQELGITLDLDARVETLGVGERQRIEIVRALVRDARVIILDEPTAVLTPGEAEALYATLRRLADGGRAIIVVTHKLDEVEGHADRVTVMRKGAIVRTDELRAHARTAVGVAGLAQAIMGAEPPPPLVADVRVPGAVRLRVDGLTLARALSGLSLEVRGGEIVGIAGVLGNGQRELVRVLARMESPDEGGFRIEGPSTQASVVHEDRHAEGLVLDASLLDNLVLGELRNYARHGILDMKAMETEAQKRAERFEVRPSDLATPARTLSGGNQQKIVMARAISRTPADGVLVVAHPTRGVDLGAARSIHAQILDVARRGTAVLVISADLHELRTLASRILVISRGRIVAELSPTASDGEIGARMVGANPQQTSKAQG